MFEFGRELKRVFSRKAGTGAFQTPRDGFTAGDASLMELLDNDM